GNTTSRESYHYAKCDGKITRYSPTHDHYTVTCSWKCRWFLRYPTCHPDIRRHQSDCAQCIYTSYNNQTSLDEKCRRIICLHSTFWIKNGMMKVSTWMIRTL